MRRARGSSCHGPAIERCIVNNLHHGEWQSFCVLRRYEYSYHHELALAKGREGKGKGSAGRPALYCHSHNDISRKWSPLIMDIIQIFLFFSFPPYHKWQWLSTFCWIGMSGCWGKNKEAREDKSPAFEWQKNNKGLVWSPWSPIIIISP